MPVTGILDSQIRQLEDMVNTVDFGGIGVLQRQPHEALRLTPAGIEFVEGHIPQAVALLIDDAVDQHEGSRTGRKVLET
jgi:hypothetical protein